MNLKQQFEAEQKELATNNIDLLFLTSNENYIKWLENKVINISEKLQSIPIEDRILNTLKNNLNTFKNNLNNL